MGGFIHPFNARFGKYLTVFFLIPGHNPPGLFENAEPRAGGE
jgi:hypothetical protein